MRTLAILVLFTSACWDDSRPIAWTRDRVILGPTPLKTQVAYADSALDRVTLLDLSGDTPAISAISIGRNAEYMVPSLTATGCS